MKRMWRLVACVGVLAVLSGCCFAPVVPPRGLVFDSQKAPLFPGPSVGSKAGKASAHNILMLFAWGDASQTAAARNGGIRQISHADYEVLNVLGVYQMYTTVVYGE